MPIILLLLFAMIAVVFYLPLLVLAGLIVVGSVIYYFAKVDWEDDNERKNALISLGALAGVSLIVILIYSSYGWVGIVVAVILLLCLIGSVG